MEVFKNKKCQGKVREFSCVKFIFSQSEYRNSENFLEKLIVVWKSQGISVCQDGFFSITFNRD